MPWKWWRVFDKVTIHPGFSGTVRFLTMYPGKNHSSPGRPICPIFGLVSRICPDLPISAAVCLCIGSQKLAQILSVYKKNHWQLWTTLPRCQVRPATAHATARSLRFAPLALVLDCGAQIMVTLAFVYKADRDITDRLVSWGGKGTTNATFGQTHVTRPSTKWTQRRVS